MSEVSAWSEKFGEKFRAVELVNRYSFLRSPAVLKILAARLDKVERPNSQEITKVTDDSLLLFHSD
jgi:hypothetical protein